MLTKQNFKCKRCADCCRYTIVKLFKEDIDKIKQAGFAEEFFLDYDCHINSFTLKSNDKGCVFLDQNKCKIYSIRPKVCKLYPFVKKDTVESCKPSLFKNKFDKKK
ncbi:MAG: YkgJ family cysteine cluster protein [Nanoarchaeota archaeon]